MILWAQIYTMYSFTNKRGFRISVTLNILRHPPKFSLTEKNSLAGTHNVSAVALSRGCIWPGECHFQLEVVLLENFGKFWKDTDEPLCQCQIDSLAMVLPCGAEQYTGCIGQDTLAHDYYMDFHLFYWFCPDYMEFINLTAESCLRSQSRLQGLGFHCYDH